MGGNQTGWGGGWGGEAWAGWLLAVASLGSSHLLEPLEPRLLYNQPQTPEMLLGVSDRPSRLPVRIIYPPIAGRQAEEMSMCRLTLSCCCYHVSRVIVTEPMSGLLLGFPGILIPGCRAGGSHRCRRASGSTAWWQVFFPICPCFFSLLWASPPPRHAAPAQPAVWMASLAVAAVPPATLPSHAQGRHDCRSHTFPAEAVQAPWAARCSSAGLSSGLALAWSLFSSPARPPERAPGPSQTPLLGLGLWHGRGSGPGGGVF